MLPLCRYTCLSHDMSVILTETQDRNALLGSANRISLFTPKTSVLCFEIQVIMVLISSFLESTYINACPGLKGTWHPPASVSQGLRLQHVPLVPSTINFLPKLFCYRISACGNYLNNIFLTINIPMGCSRLLSVAVVNTRSKGGKSLFGSLVLVYHRGKPRQALKQELKRAWRSDADSLAQLPFLHSLGTCLGWGLHAGLCPPTSVKNVPHRHVHRPV